MSQIDEFESAFKSASKPVFHYEPPNIAKVMVVLDADENDAKEFLDRTESFLTHIRDSEDEFEQTLVSGNQYSSVNELLELIKSSSPDLICTYRNLHIPSTDYPYSLGVYIDVLTQATDIPVLLLPRPELLDDSREFPSRPSRVLAVTDHLAGEWRLVSFASRFTDYNGNMTLVHVEDEHTFDRYIETIGKIPDLDTDIARKTIMDQLLKEPTDYIASCKTGLDAAGLTMSVDSIVTVGHRLSDYREILTKHQIDLLVMNTKDEDQLAMHGLAYPISVEVRKTPILLI